MESTTTNDGKPQESLEGYTCQECQQPAKLQCPKCLELKLEQEFSTFCSQDCFKVRIRFLKWMCTYVTTMLNVCRNRGQNTRRFTDLEIMHGTTVSVEERVERCIVRNSSGLGPCDLTGLDLQGRFQTPFPRLIITGMVFLDLKYEADSRVLVRLFLFMHVCIR